MDASSRVRECYKYQSSKRVLQVRWCIVWLPKTKMLLVLEGSEGCFLFLDLEYDFYLIKQTRVDFAPQTQINT
jgi:hypothetical protein